jgi:hypothetical protein
MICRIYTGSRLNRMNNSQARRTNLPECVSEISRLRQEPAVETNETVAELCRKS